jgi:nucleotidyltransferase substrate binding protein (TIGR01987 family)
MNLDLSSLEGAVATLERSVKAAAAYAASLPRELQDTVRSGIIQNFEVAYELSWKMIKRWIESNVGPDSADGVTRRELFRLAAESRLLEDVDLWMRFHNARNESSHTYDHETAEEVSKCAVVFAPAARALLSALGSRND